MSIIPFERKANSQNPAENQRVEDRQAQKEVATKVITIPKQTQTSQDSINRFSNKKIIQFTHFQKLKQNLHQNRQIESVKLRNGLVVKVHAVRQEAELVIGNSSDLFHEILEMSSKVSDEILYGEFSTIELLNKYWIFKNLVEKKVQETRASN